MFRRSGLLLAALVLQACASAPDLAETESRSEFRSCVDDLRPAAAAAGNGLQHGRQLRSVHGSASARNRRHSHGHARRAHQCLEGTRARPPRGQAASTRVSPSLRAGPLPPVGTPDFQQRVRERNDVRRPGRPRARAIARTAASRSPSRERLPNGNLLVRGEKLHHDQSRRGVHPPRRASFGPSTSGRRTRCPVDEGRGRCDHLQRQGAIASHEQTRLAHALLQLRRIFPF